MFYEAYMSPWINDEFKVNSRLTITAGLRFDYQFARTESRDQMSTFDPTHPQSWCRESSGRDHLCWKGKWPRWNSHL